jgi:hypothetical protein
MCKSWIGKKILCPPPGLARSLPRAVPGLRPGGVQNNSDETSRLGQWLSEANWWRHLDRWLCQNIHLEETRVIHPHITFLASCRVQWEIYFQIKFKKKHLNRSFIFNRRYRGRYQEAMMIYNLQDLHCGKRERDKAALRSRPRTAQSTEKRAPVYKVNTSMFILPQQGVC